MDLHVFKAKVEDCSIVFQLISILITPKKLDYSTFEKYYLSVVNVDHTEIWLAAYRNNIVAIITANKFSMIRFLGYGFEFEEIAVLPQFQGKGIGQYFINKLILHYKADKDCRKIIVKSNDFTGSCRLYERFMDKTDYVIYQSYLNKI